MSSIEKLRELQAKQKNQAQTSNMTDFNGLVVIHVGVEPTEHFPKLKDSDGNKIKDEKGADKRSEVSDGWTYTFTQFGTAKTVKIVLAKRINPALLGAFQVGGKGYDIKSGNLIFIEKDGTIANY